MLASRDTLLLILTSLLDALLVVVLVVVVVMLPVFSAGDALAALLSSVGAGSGELKILVRLSQKPALACRLNAQNTAIHSVFFIDRSRLNRSGSA